MSLREGITLSKKHQRRFDGFPYFFKHALNYFYFLAEECGFLKPKLDTWKNEGLVEFLSKDLRVVIRYESPGWVMVCFQLIGTARTICERELFGILEIPFDEALLRPSHKKYSQEPEKQIQEIENDIVRTIQYVSHIIWENHEKIFSYLRSINSLV